VERHGVDEALQALGSPHRLNIVKALIQGPATHRGVLDRLSQIGDAWYHLNMLRDVGLVSMDATNAKHVVYTLVPERLEEIAAYVSALAQEARGDA
jgi:hypothetical protein